MAKLRPRARIVRTIGDQLISGPEAALIELVKNAYDADSESVRIKIIPSVDEGPSKNDGAIFVSDAGHGMSSGDLLDKWLEPATDDKVHTKTSPNGRRMLGAKGVGRFATARLGGHLKLKAAKKVPGRRLEVSEISLDWGMFDQSKYLDEVDIAIETRPGTRGEVSGVTLEITKLRDRWTQKQLEQLIRELRRVASPISARESKFRIFLDLSGFMPELCGFDGASLVSGLMPETDSPRDIDPTEIRPLPIDQISHYSIKGVFDTSGKFKGTFINRRGDSKPQVIELPATALEEEEISCGKVVLRLNVYDREGDAVASLFESLGLGAVGRLDAKRMLDENIGIGIYRNGFRIRPYGDAETDWLELERMRVQNPSRKLGLNQVWGVVEIDGEGKSSLIERSSREGLEHNGAFERLKRLMAELLAVVESIRQDFRQTAGLSRKSNVDTEEVKNKADLKATTKAVSGLPRKYREKIQLAMQQDSQALKTSIAELETYQQALASHSTLGLVVSQVLHDGRRFLSDIATRSKRLSDGASRLEESSNFGAHFRKTFPKDADLIHQSSGALSKIFKSLDPISGKKRGKPKTFYIEEIVERCTALFEDSIKDASVTMVRNEESTRAQVVGYESDLMAALINIIDNAIHWLSTSPTKPRTLSLLISESAKYMRIEISNNGPSIDERFYPRLFNPGFSLKTEGSGIGLAIAREAMRASKGDVAFDVNADETTFVIEMQKAIKT